MERPTWDETWMTVADTVGRRSRCSRAQVGAVIVTQDNRVASVAYNGPPRGLQVDGPCSGWCPRAMGRDTLSSDYGACEAVHAEGNAVARADFTQIRLGTVYVSHSMCINCARQLGNSGIQRVVHRVTEADAHRNPDDVEAYLRSIGITVRRL